MVLWCTIISCCNAYLINDLGLKHVGAIVSVRMYSHTIVHFYIRTLKIWEMLAKANTNCHNIFNIVSATDPSGQNWSDMFVSCHMLRHVSDISS